MPPIQDDLSQLEADIANTPSEAATLAKTVMPSMTALANLAKNLLSENKTLKTLLEIPAPIIATYEATTLSQINAALASLTQLNDVINTSPAATKPPLSFDSENVTGRTFPVATLPSTAGLTFEQQIEEAKTTE